MHPGCYPAQSLRSRLRLRIAGFAIWGITLSDGIPRWQAMQIRKRKRERRGCAGKQNPALSDHTDEQPHTCSCVCGDFRSKSLKMHGISVFGVFVTLFPLSTRGGRPTVGVKSQDGRICGLLQDSRIPRIRVVPELPTWNNHLRKNLEVFEH